MSAADSIQIVSTGLVLGALVLTMLQLREVARQGRALTLSLQQVAHNGMTGIHEDPRITFFRDDPELLSWHLSSRGFTTSSPSQDKRRLYVMARLNIHQTNFINHSSGLLPKEMWDSWQRVIEADFRVTEFQEVWTQCRED